MIEMKPKDVIKVDFVELYNYEIYQQKNILLKDGLYRYLYQPVIQHGNQKRRAIEFIWRKNTYRLQSFS